MNHRPVMVAEVVEWLQPRSGGRYVDATLGGGGHAEALLRASGPVGRVFGVDGDDRQVSRARARLEWAGARMECIRARFSDMPVLLRERGIEAVDGIVFDLGWSSDQLAEPGRGLSVHASGPLDMRLDDRRPQTAADILHAWSEDELTRLFEEEGGERFAARIARGVVAARREKSLSTTDDLIRVVVHAVPASARHGRRHVATKVFQALRRAVNREREELEEGLTGALSVLGPRGRLAVISFHSGEDRVVKHRFAEAGLTEGWRVLTRKPIGPSTAECRDNPRARSAKLRVLERAEISGTGAGSTGDRRPAA